MKKKLKVVICSDDNEGRVVAFVNGKEHVYHVDAAIVPWLKRIVNYQPGKVLNILKRGRRCTTDG